MSTPKFIQAQTFVISSAGASAGDTTLTLQSFKLIDGTTNIVTANLGDQCYGTLEPNNGTQEEAIQFTGVTQNAGGTATLTGVSTVGFVYPYTVSSGLAKSHAGGVTFILSNDAALYGNLVTYMNNTAASGAALASDTISGLTKLSVTPASGSNPFAIGINNTLSSGTVSSVNPVVDTNALSTTAASGAVVRASVTTGLINSNFITFPATYSPTWAFGNLSKDASSNTTSTIAHGLGVAPKRIRVSGSQGSGSSPGGLLSFAEASGVSGNIQYLNSYFLGNGGTGSGGSFVFYNGGNTANSLSGVITVDATNITITWTKGSASTGTIYLIWEAMY